jgi:hypothetical protein
VPADPNRRGTELSGDRDFGNTLAPVTREKCYFRSMISIQFGCVPIV